MKQPIETQSITIKNEEEEREFWNAIFQNSFQKAYSEDEPDYSDVKVLEPNPKYGM